MWYSAWFPAYRRGIRSRLGRGFYRGDVGFRKLYPTYKKRKQRAGRPRPIRNVRGRASKSRNQRYERLWAFPESLLQKRCPNHERTENTERTKETFVEQGKFHRRVARGDIKRSGIGVPSYRRGKEVATGKVLLQKKCWVSPADLPNLQDIYWLLCVLSDYVYCEVHILWCGV